MGTADPDRKIPRRRDAVAVAWPQLLTKGGPIEGRGSEVGPHVCGLPGHEFLMPVRRGEGDGERLLFLIDSDRTAFGIDEQDESRVRRDLRVGDLLIEGAVKQ